MKSAAVMIALGAMLLTIQGVVGMLVSLHPFTPNLLLPIVLYLGVTPDIAFLRGALIAFVLGYMLDIFGGSPMGLHTFVLMATYLLTRGTGISLSSRGVVFGFSLTFALATFTGAAVLALRAIFERGMPPSTTAMILKTIFAPAATTALLAPVVFALLAAIETFVLPSRRTADKGLS